ncbi:MAG TPA: deoxyribose-phosphate aldolase [Candidatus Limivivens merdigallinarum]|uniref:Deoxyribose-phosphate aldolase n=1 Tax=Candidatus Limivivens merdigallinarum TaxID=2840859 RepID=A0A9D0ZX32_9FIRM|nr:deoxyribose-phosphate aldolase [Candidatus Limivivens merdigallinarum]
MYHSETITREELCRLFDHTNLKAFADEAMLSTLCQEAKDGHFAMVAINSSPVAFCKKLLQGTDVHVGAAISFPLGQTTIAAKVFETINAIENGADEIDYVINIGELKNKNLAYIRDEMQQIVDACHSRKVLCKVIFEICYLTDEEIKEVAAIAREVKPDFIKTSTGFGTFGATVEAVKLMKETVGPDVKVKAAGGIRSWETCKAMIDAGAERIGTSSSLRILEEFDQAHTEV